MGWSPEGWVNENAPSLGGLSPKPAVAGYSGGGGLSAPSGGLSGLAETFKSIGQQIAPLIKPMLGMASDGLLAAQTGDAMAPVRRSAMVNEQRMLGDENARRSRAESLSTMRDTTRAQLMEYAASKNLDPSSLRQIAMLLAANGDTEGARFMLDQTKTGTPTTFKSGHEIVTRIPKPDGTFEEVRAPRWNPNPSPAATVNVQNVMPGHSEPTNATTSDAQKKILDANGAIQRLAEIREMYRPEFQQIVTQISQRGLAWSEKLGNELSPENKAQLNDYTEYRASAYDHMSTILNQLSGAAISPQEAERLLKSLPDPGGMPGTGDSPTEFEAKLRRAEGTVKLSLIRYSYALSAGVPIDSVPLTTGVLKNRIGQMAEDAAKKAGASQSDAEAAGVRAVQQAFGGM